MKQFCIVERDSHEFHAGSKARNDVGEILTAQGWTALPIHRSQGKGTPDKLKMAAVTWMDWRGVAKQLSPGDTLLVQYPLDMYPKVSRLAIPFLRGVKEKGVQLIFLIHDLDSLRGVEGNGERQFLELADLLIAHNQEMTEYLCERGYGDKAIRTLDLFDYLLEEEPTACNTQDPWEVVVAGNLRPDKAGYVYRLGQLDSKVRFRLYGPNYQEGVPQVGVKYCGQFPPEQLPQTLRGGFGLVWDGDRLDCCDGVYGTYLKYNNPHKASLYLACGIPVMVWDQSALADYVVEHHLGIAVGSLEELPRRLQHMSREEYQTLCQGAREMGARLRRGAMLGRVLRAYESSKDEVTE